MRDEISYLASLVACRARVDKTEPDPENLRCGWRTDQLLTDIDAFVVGQENDPAIYAEIARRALEQIKADEQPEITALLNLAAFRGERLLPVSPEREQALTQMAQDLNKLVLSLPDGNRKKRCQSLLLYHLGVFSDAYGHFDSSAKLQRKSAETAEKNGDKPGAAIGHFLQAVYQLKQALCDGHPNPIEAHFAVLQKRFELLVEATRGTALEVQWGQGNGPCHMIQACVWLNRDHSNWDGWVVTALAAAEKLGQAWQPAADFVSAVNMHQCGDAGVNAALAAVAADIKQANEVKAAALLLLMRRVLAGGGQTGMEAAARQAAKEFFEQMPEQGGAQHVRAIAERLLQ